MLKYIVLALFVGVVLALPTSKVSSELDQVLKKDGVANIVVSFLPETSTVLDKIPQMVFQSRGSKISFMKSQLEELRDSSQRRAINILETNSTTFKSFWISNRIVVRYASSELVQQLRTLPEVLDIRSEIIVHIDEPIEFEEAPDELDDWNLKKIETEEAWELPGGNNGFGAVVSTIDTGVRHTHEALRNNFREVAHFFSNQEYGWYDPFNGSLVPVDEFGHGSHTMGTLVGAKVGVAPGARWITCRACNGSCTEEALTGCGEWTLCPTLPDGSNPNCDMAPILSSNSWGGNGASSFYEVIIYTWRLADIIPIFSQGNGGPICWHAGSPGDSRRVVAVGSVNEDDEISKFSGLGPAFHGGLKPDMVAPGERIRSCWNRNDTDYSLVGGTSMSVPHYAGVVALLLAQNPQLQYDQIYKLMADNTDRQGLGGNTTNCDGIPVTEFPNHTFGYGRLNARKTMNAAINGKF